MLWSACEAGVADAPVCLPEALLPAGWCGRVDTAGLALSCERTQSCLSSAVANGGLVRTRGFINMHLREDRPLGAHDPADWIAVHAENAGLPAGSVGMMTGASMRSLRVAGTAIADQRIAVVLTAGLANARRAGDTAEYHALYPAGQLTGTINLALLTSVPLECAAMAETLATLTEAKAAVLQSSAITSPVSGELATGTGTDATAVFCPVQGRPVRYTGKHTQFGECAARLVIEALGDAIAQDARVMHAG